MKVPLRKTHWLLHGVCDKTHEKNMLDGSMYIRTAPTRSILQRLSNWGQATKQEGCKWSLETFMEKIKQDLYMSAEHYYY